MGDREAPAGAEAVSPKTAEVQALRAKKSTCPYCEGRMPGELPGGGGIQAEFCRVVQLCEEGAGGKASNTSPLWRGPEWWAARPKQGDSDWAGTVLSRTEFWVMPIPTRARCPYPCLPRWDPVIRGWDQSRGQGKAIAKTQKNTGLVSWLHWPWPKG